MPHQLFDLIQSIKKGCIKTEEHLREEHDLSTAEFKGLLVMELDEQVSGGAFSNRMGLSPSRGSRVINQLVQKKLLQIEPIPDNRRAIKVFFTEHGKEVRTVLDEEIEQCEQRLMKRIPASQHGVFRETLKTLSALLNNPSA